MKTKQSIPPVIKLSLVNLKVVVSILSFITGLYFVYYLLYEQFNLPPLINTIVLILSGITLLSIELAKHYVIQLFKKDISLFLSISLALLIYGISVLTSVNGARLFSKFDKTYLHYQSTIENTKQSIGNLDSAYIKAISIEDKNQALPVATKSIWGVITYKKLQHKSDSVEIAQEEKFIQRIQPKIIELQSELQLLIQKREDQLSTTKTIFLIGSLTIELLTFLVSLILSFIKPGNIRLKRINYALIGNDLLSF